MSVRTPILTTSSETCARAGMMAASMSAAAATTLTSIVSFPFCLPLRPEPGGIDAAIWLERKGGATAIAAYGRCAAGNRRAARQRLRAAPAAPNDVDADGLTSRQDPDKVRVGAGDPHRLQAQ